ncbi:LysM domain receptor-like protein kinase 3-like protein [Quillaja saponaria]|uniref:LysM domain receptor-like protein kinase 3-like protein n=1 Tax=Quillaja saponaria TaxID=32244 RepID=A0AAD7KXK4_QUISA|nr:LysM domain receptor-like protein kinase 3-like protein [Quillaja saponaria]
MCKNKMATNASDPSPTRRTTSRSTQPTQRTPRTPRSQPTQQTPRTPKPSKSTTTSSSSDPSSSNTTSAPNYLNTSSFKLSSGTSISSGTSLSSLRDTLPENPQLYDFIEICSATNNFLAKRYSSSSTTPSWRCNLRGKDVIVFQRKFRRKIERAQLKERLSVIFRSHHISIIKLLGASISGDHIYLVYEFVNGANLSACLRNSRNPDFTVLSSWISRMQIATDLAHGLDYIHNSTGLNLCFVHNHIKSSSIIITEPSLNAKICHFGAAQLCCEIDEEYEIAKDLSSIKAQKYEGEIVEESSSAAAEASTSMKSEMKRRLEDSKMKFEGVRGYMSPEFLSTGVATQKSDVYAFGVVMLELLSGKEPLRYKFDKKTGDFLKNSVIDMAAAALEGGYGGSDCGSVEGRLRKWVDRRLKDSFPIEVAEKMTRVALGCVHVDPDKRPNMGRVAGKISKLYLESRTWADNIRMPTDISVSLAPR